MSHRQRQRTTHTLAAERRVQETDADGNPVTDEFGEPVYRDTGETVIEDVLVRYRPTGTAYVRGDTGERVRSTPSIRGPPALTAIREGDRILLTPKFAGGYSHDYGADYGGAHAYIATGMNVINSGRRIQHVVIELEGA